MIGIILTIVIVGVVLWAVQEFVPMDAKIKKLLYVVVVICLLIYLLQAFGLIGPLNSIGPK